HTLEQQGSTRYLECGPAAVLSGMAAGCLTGDAVFVASQHFPGEVDEARALVRALGALHVAGQDIAVDRVVDRAGRADLPTYAFQRQHFWLAPAAGGGDVRHSGLLPADHPWLAAELSLAGGQGHLLTGRLSLTEHPWLRDHAVSGTVLVPGTGLLDLALAAARAVGAAGVGELTLAQPFVLAEGTPVRIQVTVGPADDDGHRPVGIYSQPETTADPEHWTAHAGGHLTAAEPGNRPDGLADLLDWPVAGAEPMPLDDFYPCLAEQGLEYGPAFQGLVGLARRDGVAYGRVLLPEAHREAAGAFGVHPALLDAALHALAAVGIDDESPDTVPLPVAWTGVSLHAAGGTELRVRIETTAATGAGRTVTVLATDPTGTPVLHATGLAIQRVDPAKLRPSSADHLYRLAFQPVRLPDPDGMAGTVVLGAGPLPAALDVPGFADLDALLAGAGRPRRIVVDATGPGTGTAAMAGTIGALPVLQRLLTEPSLADAELVWVTRNAVAARPEDAVDALARTPLWGLIRAVRGEQPDRVLRLVDLDDDADDAGPLPAALALAGEPELAVRGGTGHVPRLVRAEGGALTPPPGPAPWQLDLAEPGSLDSLELIPADLSAPLGEHEVLVDVRAAGMNFRDVLNALGMVATPRLGLELAGVVLATGPGVTHLRPGDRAMGLAFGAFGTRTRGDARLLTRLPDALSFQQGATIPLAFLTAYHALVDLGRVVAGERVLVHAAAGGVGMAAVQLARHLGAEVYGTASPAKWPAVRRLGLPGDRIASSRDAGFERAWPDGVDVVLNSLAGELTDASLRMLRPGGRFLEMGKTDLRDPLEVGAAHPGVAYRAFDLMSLDPGELHRMLTALSGLLDQGVITPLPYLAYDVRAAPAAFRFMAQARHTGKIVLTVPRALDRDGTVLVTGGTGELGREVARHLVTAHGVRHLVLTSRQGPAAAGAAELCALLRAAGAASVRVLAGDVADAGAVTELVAEAGREHPLTAVVHLAATTDDGVVTNQTPDRFERVLAPKLSGAWHLHEATRELDLAAFVLFSSVAGTLGSPGQGNYAAANAFLDALAAHRNRRGLAATSLAWGLWARGGTGLTARLGEAELARMRRQGVAALTPSEGLGLLDAALARPEAHLVPVKLDLGRLPADPPAVLRQLVRPKPKRAGHAAATPSAFRDRLAGLAEEERLAALRGFVQQEVSAVLGLSGSDAAPLDKPMRDLGWDSLMAVELKNRITKDTNVAVPSTLAFDYPTPRAIADFLYERLSFGEPPAAPPDDPAAGTRWAMDAAGGLTEEEMDRTLDDVLGAL
ncbi:MAG TPA: SDR family NAD(P)-dependent oxidoreductase, partial [Actinophytocola sp.]|uniref:SDR family NAD(P)-dependent oxidoreductase n=1 Tax=Actinophytocola sp. TaxID=1872138 RepID=UPI002DBADE26